MTEPLNILIVEDEVIIALDVKNHLEKKGYNVVKIAKSCKEAIETIKSNSVDLILMDITLLGEKDGIEAANIIKNDYNIPVVYVTANYDTTIIERIKLTEPYGYIPKPINNTHLQVSIEIAYYKHQKDQERIERYNNIIVMVKEKYPEVFNEIENQFEIN